MTDVIYVNSLILAKVSTIFATDRGTYVNVLARFTIVRVPFIVIPIESSSTTHVHAPFNYFPTVSRNTSVLLVSILKSWLAKTATLRCQFTAFLVMIPKVRIAKALLTNPTFNIASLRRPVLLLIVHIDLPLEVVIVDCQIPPLAITFPNTFGADLVRFTAFHRARVRRVFSTLEEIIAFVAEIKSQRPEMFFQRGISRLV